MEATFMNASGGLTFSGDGISYSYIGQASFQTVTQMHYDSSLGSNVAGYSTYVINWPGDILVALPLNSAGVSCVKNIYSNGTTWTIEVFCGNGQQDSSGYETQVQGTVHVFGAPSLSTIGGAQFTLYDANGNPCADLMRRPLTTKGLLYMAADMTSAPCPAGPVGILGTSNDNYYDYPSDRGGWTAIYRTRGWHYNAGTNRVERNLMTYQSLRVTSNPKPTFDGKYESSAIFVDLAGL